MDIACGLLAISCSLLFSYWHVSLPEIQNMIRATRLNSKAFQNLLLIALFGIILLFIAIYFIIKNDFMLSVVRPVILFLVGSIFYEYREKITLNKWGGAIAFVEAISGYIGLFSIGMLVFLPYSVLAFTLGIAQIDIDWKIFKISYEVYLLGWPIQQTVFGFLMTTCLHFSMYLSHWHLILY